MPRRDALNTPFTDAQATPDMGGTLPGTTGGFTVQNPSSGGGLSQVAFPEAQITSAPMTETGNSSGLPLQVTTVSVPDGPGVGENIPDRGVSGTPMPKVTGT